MFQSRGETRGKGQVVSSPFDDGKLVEEVKKSAVHGVISIPFVGNLTKRRKRRFNWQVGQKSDPDKYS